jgi:hypothetical protein
MQNRNHFQIVANSLMFTVLESDNLQVIEKKSFLCTLLEINSEKPRIAMLVELDPLIHIMIQVQLQLRPRLLFFYIDKKIHTV